MSRLGMRRATHLLIAAVVFMGCALVISAQADMFVESTAYERFMGRWSRQLAPLFVTFVGIGAKDSVLDVGSGTGVLALTIAE